MTKRDFFILLIKVFGLFTLITSVFSGIPSSVTLALMGVDFVSILWIMLAATAVGGLFVVLVFKADRVVQVLRLDRGFDDDRIELGNLKPADVVRIAAFIFG